MAKSNINQREEGSHYEDLACKYLAEKGHVILERNFRCRFGEIDIITKDRGYLVFVEVKYRSTLNSGAPADAVNYRKIRTICKVSDYYRFKHKLGEPSIRFDVISITKNEVSHIENAFDYING